jgi:hypothetical protein
MNQDWIVDALHDIKKGPPDLLLVAPLIGPEAVLKKRRSLRESQADEIIETEVRQTLDIKVDRSSTDCKLRRPNDVNLPVSNCQSFESMVISFSARCQMLGSAAWAKCVRQLSNGENPFRVELRSVCGAKPTQKAEIVLLCHFLPTTSLKAAL